MSMKVVKEKKTKQKKTGKEGTGKVRRTWNRSNDKVRDVLHSAAFLSPSVTGVAVFSSCRSWWWCITPSSAPP